MMWSMARWSVTSCPTSAGAIMLPTFCTACSTPRPRYRCGSLSRSSRASNLPVEAPEGTMPEAFMWLSKYTVASTVGLPRESNNS